MNTNIDTVTKIHKPHNNEPKFKLKLDLKRIQKESDEVESEAKSESDCIDHKNKKFISFKDIDNEDADKLSDLQ